MIGFYIENSSSFPVYTYGEMIIKNSYSYFISWAPSDLSGSFQLSTVYGSVIYYNFEDYSGFFTDNDGELRSDITPYAFMRTSGLTSIVANVTGIGSHAFDTCSSLKSVNLPFCTNIQYNAFEDDISLEYVNIPLCHMIPANAFKGCTSLKSISIPSCTMIWDDAFLNCYSLSMVYAPMVDEIVDMAFASCYALQSINLQRCRILNYGIFRNCSMLSSISLPNINNIGSWAFASCTALSFVSCPDLYRIQQYAFYNCTSLKSVYISGDYSEIYIGNSAFLSCSNLSKITINSPYVISLSGGSGQFRLTPIASGTGSIYVPSSLVSEYKNASIWSSFSNIIYPINN